MLAIIIPYYKRTFFEATLQSLAAQTCQDFKVYIGNDASTEDPADLLQHFQGQFDFVYRRFETNLGSVSLTQQWERCIGLSENEPWLMILGDDDLFGEKVVEEFYKNLEEIEAMGCNVVRFATQIIDEEGKAISEVYEHPKLEKATDAFWRKFKGETRSSLSEYIFSRSTYVFNKFTYFPLGWFSDDKAWLDFSQSKNIISINNVLVSIRLTDFSISGQKNNIELKRLAKHFFLKYLIENYFNFFSENQKITFLFEYGILLKEFNNKSVSEVAKVFFSFLRIGSFYNGFRFLRRMYIIKK